MAKTTKPIPVKKLGKQDRERKVLFGLIDHYLESGKPVGSHTLQEAGFEDLSSATLRNYFSHLEETGYLRQQHASGGRIPTNLAYRLYAKEFSDAPHQSNHDFKDIHNLKATETKEIALFLQQAAEKLSNLTKSAIFLSAPRFDHDFVVDIKLVGIDNKRCLCVIVTDFGLVQTELLHTDKKLTPFSIKRIESYFYWRLTGSGKPEGMDLDEEQLAIRLYNELMVRYIVSYSSFSNEDIYRTGFSKLLSFPDFTDGMTLANTLALFENSHSIRMLIKECRKMNKLRFWIGEDLDAHCAETPQCSVLAIPYYINLAPVGAVGILGPTRMPYKENFGILRAFSESISEALTKSLYKYKITFRQPNESLYLRKEEHQLIGRSRTMLLEDQSD